MRIRFDRGTVVLEAEAMAEDPAQIQGTTWDHLAHAWRIPAAQHASAIGQLTDAGVRVADELSSGRLARGWSIPTLRAYQREAIDRWHRAGDRGVVALPTGSGKTIVALAAIAERGVDTLILVPTRVLLEQWVEALARCWPHAVGRLGDGEHVVAPITVSTYASAVTWMPRIGDRFGMIVVDEAHHVGGWCPSDVLEMTPAPARLGLTATPPMDRAALARQIGPVVYSLGIDDLEGTALASYALVTVSIELTPAERASYRDHRARFTAFYAPVQRAHADLSWRELVKIARDSRSGRDALEAWRSYRGLIAYPAGKRRALRDLLVCHDRQRTLVFTGDNAAAYAIARELLVAPITHEIGKTERAATLARFRSGEISVLVSSQVLDEGLDVPDADVAIIVGGTASERRHVQRIGRVLRPRDGKRATIYELVVRDTVEVGYAARRRGQLRDGGLR